MRNVPVCLLASAAVLLVASQPAGAGLLSGFVKGTVEAFSAGLRRPEQSTTAPPQTTTTPLSANLTEGTLAQTAKPSNSSGPGEGRTAVKVPSCPDGMTPDVAGNCQPYIP